MLIKHDEIVKEVATKLDIPYEQCRIVFNDFYHQLLMHLQHPENNFIRGIRIKNCIKFILNPKQICKSYCKCIADGNIDNTTNFVENLKIVNKQLIDNECYTKRQKEAIQNSERDRIHTSREEGSDSNE